MPEPIEVHEYPDVYPFNSVATCYGQGGVECERCDKGIYFDKASNVLYLFPGHDRWLAKMVIEEKSHLKRN